MEGTLSEIRLFAGDFAPRGWANCNGQIIAITQNQALFSLLGTTFGGNGINTFALPDLRGRAAVGIAADGSVVMGAIAGEVNHTLITSEMPAHIHQIATPYAPTVRVNVSDSNATDPTAANGSSLAQMGTAEGRGGFNPVMAYGAAAPDTSLSSAGVTMNSVTESSIGGNQAHNNMQPYLGVPYVICMQGYFPSRN